MEPCPPLIVLPDCCCFHPFSRIMEQSLAERFPARSTPFRLDVFGFHDEFQTFSGIFTADRAMYYSAVDVARSFEQSHPYLWALQHRDTTCRSTPMMYRETFERWLRKESTLSRKLVLEILKGEKKTEIEYQNEELVIRYCPCLEFSYRFQVYGHFANVVPYPMSFKIYIYFSAYEVEAISGFLAQDKVTVFLSMVEIARCLNLPQAYHWAAEKGETQLSEIKKDATTKKKWPMMRMITFLEQAFENQLKYLPKARVLYSLFRGEKCIHYFGIRNDEHVLSFNCPCTGLSRFVFMDFVTFHILNSLKDTLIHVPLP